MDNKQWSFGLASLGRAMFVVGTVVGLMGEYQIGYNFSMLATPILLTAIWYEIRK